MQKEETEKERGGWWVVGEGEKCNPIWKIPDKICSALL